MLTVILTTALLLVIIEGNIYYSKDMPSINSVICGNLVANARKRYLDAYKNVDVDMSSTFDTVIRQLKLVDGEFKLQDRYTFKHVLVDAVSLNKYNGTVRRSEAMFVTDFIMEAYYDVAAKYNHRVDVNLSKLKESV